MATSGNIHTIKNSHAIKEAVISFTTTPQIFNPNSYGKLLNEGEPLHGRYQKFEPVKLRELKVETGLNTRTYDSIKDAGFKMLSFRDGSTSEVVQALSQPRQSLFTFNTVNYQGWHTFSTESLETAKIIANFNPIYVVKAFSLMFIDEFYFEKDYNYNPTELFNLNSKNLPRGIEDSDFVDYNLNLRRHHDKKSYLENVSIKVFTENSRKTIRITDNITFIIEPLPFIELLSYPDLIKHLDFIHDENKNTLRDILSPTISKMIQL